MAQFVRNLIAYLYIGVLVIGSVLCSLAILIAELAGFPCKIDTRFEGDKIIYRS